MFGKDNSKEIRLALEESGCNMDSWRQWQKKYDRLLKQLPAVRGKYESAKAAAIEVQKAAKSMEKIIADRQQDAKAREFAELVKVLKKNQNAFDHIFLISPEDKEFHSTYDSILKMGTRSLKDDRQRLILQSEIENLLSLFEENLNRKEPDLCAYGYYALEYDVETLADLSPMVRREKVSVVYESEFKKPFVRMAKEAIVFADSRKRILENSTDRGTSKKAEVLQILWNSADDDRTTEQRAEKLLAELMEMEG